MTCREKLAQEYPEHIDQRFTGGCWGCPQDYGYASKPKYCKVSLCEKCWDREISEPPKPVDMVDKIANVYHRFIFNGLSDTKAMTLTLAMIERGLIHE